MYQADTQAAEFGGGFFFIFTRYGFVVEPKRRKCTYTGEEGVIVEGSFERCPPLDD
jgi:hypothetical protein